MSDGETREGKMKRLSREGYDAARRFLETQARPLDWALFEFHFEGAAADNAIDELARFQNHDGGFGRALEPDLRTPTPSALATGIGLHTLKELGCSGDHPLVRSAVTFLLETFDKASKVWRIAPHDTNAHPHAPWWHDQDGSLARTFDGFLINPRAELVGLLYDFSALVPADWLADLAALTVKAIETAETAGFGGGGDTLRCALAFAETDSLPRRYAERLAPRLRSLASAVVSRDPQEWSGYCAKPLKVAPSPSSSLADLLWDDLQVNLDYEIDGQSPEGSWDPVWTWGDLYPEAWEAAKLEWRGRLTLDTLTTLRAFGRIAD
jgi:hypothetical protein